MITPEQLCRKVQEIYHRKGKAVIAIDGRCGAGKSTLGAWLAEQYHARLFHMDDFFLRPEQRTPERFAEAGGNFDRERFLEEVIPFIGKKETFSYRIFDCSKMCLFGNAEISDSALVIVEGSYSHHPAFAEVFDLRVFLRVDEAERKRRIIERNGEMSKMFFTRWIPLENRYFEAFQIEEKADLVIRG
jgi:uridine kinase